MAKKKQQASQQGKTEQIQKQPSDPLAVTSQGEQGYQFKLRSERDREFPIHPRYIAIVIVVLLVILGAIAFTDSIIFQSPDSINYNDYIGVWQEDASEDVEKEGGAKLRIHSVSGGTLLLSLEYYDGSTANKDIIVDDVGAVIRDGEAYYAFSDDGQGNSGNGVLAFKGRKIEWKSVLNHQKEAYYDVERVLDSTSDKKQKSVEAEDEDKASEPSSEVSETEEEEDYILPNSAEEYLTMEDLEGLSPEELRLARNEILARHGRQFQDPELSAYFESKDWYEGTIDGETFDAEHTGELNEYERRNVDLILSVEEGY